MAISAKELFPNPEDRAILKMVLDMFNGKIVRIKEVEHGRPLVKAYENGGLVGGNKAVGGQIPRETENSNGSEVSNGVVRTQESGVVTPTSSDSDDVNRRGAEVQDQSSERQQDYGQHNQRLMREVKLRGQLVTVDDNNKLLNVSIRKPMGKVFSLSDRIVSFLDKGYSVRVNLPKRTQTITDIKKSFQKEEVKSKFSGYPPWHRYWFVMEDEDENRDKEVQGRLVF